ncbi:unnamed protein product [Adineta ricciae]|uniref:Uncharacterized protein n=1 Tax=Adineta ricciae TaxID=249248 RepID=A0A814W3N6_ADIRI|nr:unnamed protein product [Adineta ricciae]
MKNTVFLRIIIVFMTFNDLHSEVLRSSSKKYSSLCVCYSTPNELFLSIVSLLRHNDTCSVRHCHQGQFYPPLFHLTQLIPQLINHSHCLRDFQCLHSLHTPEHCNQCYISSSLMVHNHSFQSEGLPMSTCFHLCQYDPSCGTLCLNEQTTVALSCYNCQSPRSHISCYCIQANPLALDSSIVVKSSKKRWMEKLGLPAAGYLFLLILSVIPLFIVVKLIYQQLDRYQNGSIDRRTHIHMNRKLFRRPSAAV